ncbi:phosphoglycolate phosphatase [Spongorhabdus nitratireducens]
MKLREWFGDRLPELIMYDLDGTLVESVPDLAAAVDQMLTALGRPAAGNEKVSHWVGNGVVVMVKRALADDMDGHLPGRVDDDLFEAGFGIFKTAYARSCGKYSDAYSGVREFLEAMKQAGVKQAIVTNKSDLFTRQLLTLLKLDHYFELMISGDSLAEMKPHPLPLLHVMEKLGSDKDASLMIGDSTNDIKAARAAGVKVIGLPYGYNHGQPISNDNPDLVVDSLDKLL